ncbi:TetR/AcrR family transcriptional regulator C-terminal domain-containing protein, partial [Candidatus Phycosocius spiralis]|uniref:TetR/AcrR family transcriptional regulator C-terminal domain-containing protein n=1 Tax=Candidatus Phycosocius spiralis TaxID=2815099 RepID=UPI0024E0E611
ILIPLALKHAGQDPAVSSGVLVTFVTDLVVAEQIEGACRLIDNHRGPTKPLLNQLVRDARLALSAPGALAPWRIAVGEADRFPDLAAFLRNGFIEPIERSIEKLFERSLAAKEVRGASAATLSRLFCAPVAAVAMMLATFGDDEDADFDVDRFLSAHVEGFWRGWSVSEQVLDS